MLKVMKSLSVCLNISIHVRKKLLVNVVRNFSNATVRLKSQREEVTMKVLNVAEKNDAAKNIAGHLSRGTSNRVS